MINKLRRTFKENSSVILSVAASAGVVGTAYLSAQAGRRTEQRISAEDPHGMDDFRTNAWRVWRLYIPAATAGAVTVICIAGVKHVDGRKTLAAQTALAVTQRAYSEYRDKVVEEFGERKDAAILAKVAEDRVAAKPPTIVAGSGKVLCCELFTGRYFESDMQTLHRAVNELNSKMLKSDIATLEDFYYLIGLEFTKGSAHMGWDSSKLLELEFSTTLHDDKPVLAFDYNYVKGF